MGFRNISMYVLGVGGGVAIGYIHYLKEKKILDELDLTDKIPKYPYPKPVRLTKLDILKYRHIIVGAALGLGTSCIINKYGSVLGSVILNSLPQVATYFNKPEKISSDLMAKLKEIIDIRQQIRYDTAMKIVNDPELTSSDIIAMFKRRYEKVSNMVNGPHKTKIILSLISLLTFVILTNVLVFSPLIKILRDLMFEANLNNELKLELSTKFNNQTLGEIISDLVKDNKNFSHLND